MTAAETAREDLHRINATVSNELKSKSEALEKVSKDYSGLRDRTSKLHKEVRILRTKTLRAPGQHSRATEAAIAKVVREFEAESHDLRIKRPDGRIENWVRDLSCRLSAGHRSPFAIYPHHRLPALSPICYGQLEPTPVITTELAHRHMHIGLHQER